MSAELKTKAKEFSGELTSLFGVQMISFVYQCGNCNKQSMATIETQFLPDIMCKHCGTINELPLTNGE